MSFDANITSILKMSSIDLNINPCPSTESYDAILTSRTTDADEKCHPSSSIES